MIKRIKSLVVLVVIITALPNLSEAQTSISSPYSRYGIGNTDNLFNNAIQNAIGGLGYTYQRNNSVNYMNPASYAGVDTASLVFDIGFYSEWVNLSNKTYSSRGNNTSLSHILLAFPIGHKFKVAFGLMPMSTINFNTSKDSVSAFGKYRQSYLADGGINKIALGLAYVPIKNLSIGVNFEYIYGNYYKSSTVSFPDSAYVYSSRIENNYHIRAFDFNLGIQYFQPLSNGDRIGLGVVYDLPSTFPTDNILSRHTFTTIAGLISLQDSILEKRSKGEIKYPSTIGGGVSYERPNKFFVGVDAKYTNWSEFKFQSDYVNTNLVDNFKVSAGGEWKPDEYGNYFQKSIYRFGLSFDNGMLELNKTKIQQLGVSLGIGLPIKKSNTAINISFEYLKRGTTDNNLISEDYFRLGLSFSAKDVWFFKRKYQ